MPKPVALLIFILYLMVGCKTLPVKREIRTVEEISSISADHKFMKAHLKSGSVYVLHSWKFDDKANTLTGYGSQLDINRRVVNTRGGSRPSNGQKGEGFTIPLADVALLETNDTGPSIGGPLAVVTGIAGVMAIICLTNPKACFGSCPTFYASDGNALVLQAEGFSTSVSPALEKNDIDMLYSAKASKHFELIVTNEALETHVIRYANILALPKKDNERVFAGIDGLFYRCSDVAAPVKCLGELGECSDKVSFVDGAEYFSLADPINLNSKEELILKFPAQKDKKVGLVISKRQTLLTTYLMYQGLAYMGKSVTYWMAELERGTITAGNGVFALLGGIEVFIQDETGNWNFQGVVNETGPIATDYSIIPLSLPHHKRDEIKVKLRMNKGLWRIDYLGLGTIEGTVLPAVVEPTHAEVINGSESNPLSKLINEHEYLVTYPGDSYKIVYELPFEKAELFLDSKGYYLEWIREAWIKEQNFRKLNVMMNKPSQYLKKAAKEFKKLEPAMEETFWNSRYVK